MKNKSIKLITLLIIVLFQSACTICKTNTYKDDITIKYREQLTGYFGAYKIKDRASFEENLCDDKENTHDKYTIWTITYFNNDIKEEVKLNNKEELTDQINKIVSDKLIKEIESLLNPYLSEKHQNEEKIHIGNIPTQINLTNFNSSILTSNSKIYIYLKTKNSTNNNDIYTILTNKLGQNINYIVMDKGAYSSTYCIEGIEYTDKHITLEDYLNYLDEN